MTVAAPELTTITMSYSVEKLTELKKLFGGPPPQQPPAKPNKKG